MITVGRIFSSCFSPLKSVRYPQAELLEHRHWFGGRGYIILSFGTLGTGQSYFATKEPDIIPKTCGYLRSHLLPYSICKRYSLCGCKSVCAISVITSTRKIVGLLQLCIYQQGNFIFSALFKPSKTFPSFGEPSWLTW